MSEKVYHRNKGFPVEKCLPDGQIMHTYDSLHKAMKAEKVGHGRLLLAIRLKQQLNGHVFRFMQGSRSKKMVNNEAIKRQPWEGKNENFDVDGWAGLALPV